MTTPASPPAPSPASDLDWGAFRENGPWILPATGLAWMDGVGRLRAGSRAEVPRLLARHRLPPARRFVRVGGVLSGALIAWYVGGRRRGGVDSRADVSRRLRMAFEALGPTYIKLGQIISSGEGIFPEELVSQFRLLRDRVRAETFETVRAVIEEDLRAPLGSIFSSFDPRPVAAASIAEVHRATLQPGSGPGAGREVVVKVQRPSVARLVRSDLAAMSWIAPLLVGRIPIAALANPPALVELFAETIVEELDFRLEAANMIDIARVLRDTGEESGAIVVPRPHPALVTRRVLVMERLDGFAFDDVAGIRGAGIDTARVVTAGMVAFLEGAMLHGVFHGDLHGGNLFVLDDGRTALLDYGITGRLDEQRRLAFLRLVMGATVNDLRMQLHALCDLGALPPDTDIEAVISDLDLERPVTDPLTQDPEEFAAEIRELTKALLAYGARMPKELMLFVKDLLFLDGAIATLAPDIDLFGEITKIATYFAVRHGERIAAEVGVDPRRMDVDLDGLRGSMGLTPEVRTITYRDLQQRRETMQRRMAERRQRQDRRSRRRGYRARHAGVMFTRRLGRTGHLSSVAILGGAAYARSNPDETGASFRAALARGVNHIDIAPQYGDAEILVGPHLEPVRDRMFVAAKSLRHQRDGVWAQLEETLRRLRTDHLDLYQLHAVTSLEELERRSGAVDALMAARDEGLTRFIGITGHDLGAPAAAHEALRRWDLDTVMFPVYAGVWADDSYRRDAEALLAECGARDVGVMAIKAVAWRAWGARERTAATWYEPHASASAIDAGLAFALTTPGVHACCTPGDVGLLGAVLDAVDGLDPAISVDERARARQIDAGASEPVIFPMPA